MHYDFHCHSNVSDGSLPPVDVVKRAALRGVRVLALTDHDDTRGLASASEEALQQGLLLVPGVEVSASWCGQTLHIVGLGIDALQQTLASGLQEIRAGRAIRARLISESLAEAGIDGALEGALCYAANPDLVGRVHFARFLIAQGLASDLTAVFKRYLVPCKPGYVAHEWAPLSDAIAWIRAAGGLAVLAHPGRYSLRRRRMRSLLAEFKALGGAAIEVATSNHSREQVAEFGQLAVEFELYASGGSDFHGVGHHAELGRFPALPLPCLPVWEALQLDCSASRFGTTISVQ